MKYFAGSIFAVGAILGGILSYFKSGTISGSVPMHWGLNGQPDRYGSRWEALLFVPILLAVMAVVFSVIGLISGSRLRVNAVRGINIVAVAVTAMMLAIHSLILSQNHTAIPGLIPFFLSGLMVVLGFAVKGVEPNPFIGIRVPWTMNSPMVWRITHERASRLWINCGTLGLVMCLIHVPTWLPIAMFCGSILYPVYDSYRVSKTA